MSDIWPSDATDQGEGTVLVTRPEPDASRFADILASRGFRPIVAPMMRITSLQTDTILTDLYRRQIQALIMTSANAVRSIGAPQELRTLPLYAVGNGTGSACRASEYADVRDCGGTATHVLERVRVECTPGNGAIIHLSGRTTRGSITEKLVAFGFDAERIVVYEARPIDHIDSDVRAMLLRGAVDVATFFSPRTARTFARLVHDEGLNQTVRTMTALCISGATADSIRTLPWRTIVIANEPSQDAMLEELSRLAREARR